MPRFLNHLTRAGRAGSLKVTFQRFAAVSVSAGLLAAGAAPALAEAICYDGYSVNYVLEACYWYNPATECDEMVPCNDPKADKCFSGNGNTAFCTTRGFGQYSYGGPQENNPNYTVFGCPGGGTGCGTAGSTSGCTFNGQTVSHGASVTAYQDQTVQPPATCQSETRTCNNGSLSGSYQYAACTVGGFSLRPDDLNQ